MPQLRRRSRRGVTKSGFLRSFILYLVKDARKVGECLLSRKTVLPGAHTTRGADYRFMWSARRRSRSKSSCRAKTLALSEKGQARSADFIALGHLREIWYKSLEDSSVGLALFNRGQDRIKITAPLAKLQLQGKWVVRDVWGQRDLGQFSNEYSIDVPSHGSVLLRLLARSGTNRFTPCSDRT